LTEPEASRESQDALSSTSSMAPHQDEGRLVVSDYRSLQATFVPRAEFPGQGRLYFWCMPPRRVDYARRVLAALGVLRRGKSPPTGRIDLVIPTPTRNQADDWEIAELFGVRLPLVETVRGLVRLDIDEADKRRISDSVRLWILASKLAVELVSRGHFVPLIDRLPNGRSYARWAIAAMAPETRERIATLERAMPLAAHALLLEVGGHDGPRDGKQRRKGRRPVSLETTVWAGPALFRAFLDAVADAMCREVLPSTSRDRPRKDNRELAPWELRWRYALTAADPTFELAGLAEQPLADEILRWAAPVSPRHDAGSSYSVCYQLERPGSAPEIADVPDAWFLRFMLQSNDTPHVIVSAQDVWDAGGRTVVVDGRSFRRGHEAVLESLAEVANIFPACARSLFLPKPYGTILTTEEAWDFISRVGPVLVRFGLGVRVPTELRADGRQRLRLRLHVGESAFGDHGPSRVGIDALTSFRWRVALGEHDLTPDEFREIASMKRPLVQWRGEWMAVDPAAMAEMERLFDDAEGLGVMDRSAALSAALVGSMASDVGDIEVVAEGEIRDLVRALLDREKVDTLPTPKSFSGTLRPYQERGMTWLSEMGDVGFGACLADDMGLGKTIQVIASLLHDLEAGRWTEGGALLVCPTSVLGNWERELRRFAPTLRVVRHHGRGRAERAAALRNHCKPGHVVLTTYVIARLDQDLLAEQTWGYAIVDEAQNIKNPRAQQAQAVFKLSARRRVALTGTPVENRLTELWSILQFANPGLLGTLGEFQRRFALPIERFGDAQARDVLRRLVAPFILRRVKSDPNVIQDLPDKQEYKVYCTLTREQASLYQAAVDDVMTRIERSKGVERRGNILALLTRLKQICNHPAHFLKDDSALRARSGKLTRLTEMMEEVIAEREHALVFTQYKEMGDLLVKHFQEALRITVPFLHGGVSARAREAMVAQFQSDPHASPVLLLSIKAGGTGLNLTRATHVFHFDRWWNPAVEDQASDRAYRVGQTKNVLVHKLVVSGTIEEKIDEILESKRGLADAVVGEGEAWLTELDDDALREIFALDRGAAIYEEGDTQ